MVADEFGPNALDQRVIDLAIEQVLDAALLHVGQAAGCVQGLEHSAVAVRAEEERVLFLEHQLAGLHVDSRHCALAEDLQVVAVQAEVVVRVEELDGLAVSCRTGHQVERDASLVTLRGRSDFFDENLKERCVRSRADRVHPFRMLEAESRALAAGDDDDADQSRFQSRFADSPCGFLADASRLARLDRLRFLDAADVDIFCFRWIEKALVELLNLLEINAEDFRREGFLFLDRELVPELKQMLLPMSPQLLREMRVNDLAKVDAATAFDGVRVKEADSRFRSRNGSDHEDSSKAAYRKTRPALCEPDEVSDWR